MKMAGSGNLKAANESSFNAVHVNVEGMRKTLIRAAQKHLIRKSAIACLSS